MASAAPSFAPPAPNAAALEIGDLPGDLLALALQFADHKALLRLEQVSTRVRAVVAQFGRWRGNRRISFALWVVTMDANERLVPDPTDLWRGLAQSQLLLDRDRQRQRCAADWKRLALLAKQTALDDEHSRLCQVRGTRWSDRVHSG